MRGILFSEKRKTSIIIDFWILFPALLLFILINSKAQATPSLKFKHRDVKIEHKCNFCHHRKPRQCSICHTSGVEKEKTYDKLPDKIKRLHKQCRDCHIKVPGLLQKAEKNLKEYVKADSKCLKCHS